MKTLKILFVSILFTLAFTSCTDLEDDNLDTNAVENIQATGDISQDNGSKP
ncbi:hypothetical protein [Polaribacter sp.]|uniref:hypothetical protein n=1 Tax=Polaribacter sp. TaxID=1920175 RepID=UPI003EF258A6